MLYRRGSKSILKHYCNLGENKEGMTMSFLDNLYAIKNDLNAVLESEKDEDAKTDKIAELEEKIETIKKKETRGFISKDEAEEEIDEVAKKLKEIKEKIDKKDE